MKVNQLIELLEQLNPELDVVVKDTNFGGAYQYLQDWDIYSDTNNVYFPGTPQEYID